MKHVTNKMRGAKMLRETFRYSVIADAVVSAVIVACRGKRSPNSIYNNSRSTAPTAAMLIIITWKHNVILAPLEGGGGERGRTRQRRRRGSGNLWRMVYNSDPPDPKLGVKGQ